MSFFERILGKMPLLVPEKMPQPEVDRQGAIRYVAKRRHLVLGGMENLRMRIHEPSARDPVVIGLEKTHSYNRC